MPTSHGWQYNLPGNFHVRNASEHIHPGTKDSYRQDSQQLPPCSMMCRLPSQVQPVSNIEIYTQLLGLRHTTSFSLRLGQWQRALTPELGFTRAMLDPSSHSQMMAVVGLTIQGLSNHPNSVLGWVQQRPSWLFIPAATPHIIIARTVRQWLAAAVSGSNSSVCPTCLALEDSHSAATHAH